MNCVAQKAKRVSHINNVQNVDPITLLPNCQRGMIDSDLDMLPRRDNIKAESKRKEYLLKYFQEWFVFKNAKQVVSY